ncbi:uncharacterized protein N0V89_003928 [Didymosphaeria variabile]|uniref:AB hydrolase-1 domain-containing protein n=1 Tax=Didymosphaeria variabile TaxID=1932322 RepID=A0A9W8XNI4_9PLEO|nr:uncharacterized protein N0V89_003928 [Didymosphaeria variabile]KAJ4355903.1 hypothetical protein N0V89_003928 [Didymosphaeria variabile]
MHVPRLFSWLTLACATALAANNETAPGIIPGTTGQYIAAGGHRYYYLEANPVNASLGTILLFHGFPDFSYAWRYQVPFLTSLGYRVIAPDMLGYGNTDTSCDVSDFALKKMSTDMVEVLDQIAPGEKIIIGAHDWGAGLAYSFAMWYPEYLKAFFTISIPYTRPWLGPSLEWIDMLDLVQNHTYPTMAYQLQWRDPAVNRNFSTKSQVRSFLNAGFGGLTEDGRGGLSPFEGMQYDIIPLLRNQTLVNPEDFEIYVENINQKGMSGGFNWYRTRRMNWEDELPLAKRGDFKYRTPHLFIPATNDSFMPPELYTNMGQYFESETVEPVEAGHWAMWEKPDQVNEILRRWIAQL